MNIWNNTEQRSGASSRRLLLVIIALSVALRLASAMYHGPTIQPLPGVTDQVSYHELALRVMDGHGFSFGTNWWPATKANQPTAHWSFLYVLFLAAIYSVVGPVPLVARIIQVVIVGVLHPWLAWRIGNRLFGAAVGLASAALTSVYLYFAYYGGALLTESLYIVAFLWVLDVATAIGVAAGTRRAASLKPWLLLGVAFAVTALLRQLFLLVVPFILMWLIWQLWITRARRAAAGQMSLPAMAGRLALTMTILAAAVLPWTERNYRAFGTFVLLNTNAGFVFFWGNHPFHGTEFVPILPSDPNQVNYQTLLPTDLKSLNEAELDKALLVRGFGFVRDDPARYVLLSISRVKEYFKFWPTADSSRSSNLVRVLSFGLYLPLLAGGMLLALWRYRVGIQTNGDWQAGAGTILLVVVAAVYTGVHILTWTLVRYRLPVDAISMPFAGLAVVYLIQRVSSFTPELSFPSTAPRTNPQGVERQ